METIVFILRQGGAIAVAGVLWVALQRLSERYAKKEDRADADAAKAHARKDKLQDARVSDVDGLHRHYVSQIVAMADEQIGRLTAELDAVRAQLAESQAARIADQKLIVSGAAALADVTDLLGRAMQALESERKDGVGAQDRVAGGEPATHPAQARRLDARPPSGEEGAPR